MSLSFLLRSYLTGLVAVGSATGLDVSVFDVDDTEGVSWDDTSLVETEPVLLLCLGLERNKFLGKIKIFFK